MLHVAEWLYTLIFYDDCNEFENNFVFASNSPGKLSLYTDHFITQLFEQIRISIIWIVLILPS